MFVNKQNRASRLFSALSVIVFAATIAAKAPGEQAADPTSYGMTSGRLMATTSAALALIGVVIGVLALLRPTGRFGTTSGHLGAFIALAGGVIGTVVGGWMAATASGTRRMAHGEWHTGMTHKQSSPGGHPAVLMD